MSSHIHGHVAITHLCSNWIPLCSLGLGWLVEVFQSHRTAHSPLQVRDTHWASLFAPQAPGPAAVSRCRRAVWERGHVPVNKPQEPWQWRSAALSRRGEAAIHQENLAWRDKETEVRLIISGSWTSAIFLFRKDLPALLEMLLLLRIEEARSLLPWPLRWPVTHWYAHAHTTETPHSLSCIHLHCLTKAFPATAKGFCCCSLQVKLFLMLFVCVCD